MSKLRFMQLQEEFGVAAGTLREALAHLESEGFVHGQAGRGYKVAPISRQELDDIVALRIQIERSALGSAMEIGSRQWEDEIVLAFHRLSRLETGAASLDAEQEREWIACHRQFHLALVSACESPWTLRFHALLFDQAHRYRMISMRVRRENKYARMGEHRAIVEAVLGRDHDHAIALSEQHIRLTAQIISSQFTDGILHSAGMVKD